MRTQFDQRYVVAASCVLALLLSTFVAVTAYQMIGDPLAELSQSESEAIEDGVDAEVDADPKPDTAVLGIAETTEEDTSDVATSQDRTSASDTDAEVPLGVDVSDDDDEDEDDDSSGAGTPSLIVAPEQATVGGRIWIDANGNGIQDRLEVSDPTPVTVRLLDENGFLVDTTTTNEGSYAFVVEPGAYQIFFEVEQESISPRFATVASRDSDAAPAGFRVEETDPLIPGALTDLVIVVAGENNTTKDVGLVNADPGIELTVQTNSVANSANPDGEFIVGTTVEFVYEIVNSGTVTLTNISLTDDLQGTIECFTDRDRRQLPPGGSVMCKSTAFVIDGDYSSAATVTATAIDSLGDPISTVSASGIHEYTGKTPFTPLSMISIVSTTNGQSDDADQGLELTVGDDVTFGFDVTNTGNVDVVDIVVSEPGFGDVCTFVGLAPGETKSCPPITSVVTAGQYQVVFTAKATPLDEDGDRLDQQVSSSDPSFYVGVPASTTECVANIAGPRMLAGGITVDETGYVAQAGSTIRIVTSEPGASPDQPNEQVYVQIADDLYGPTPIELGLLEIEVANTGPIVFLHHSEVTGDDSRANSVEYVWCGTELSVQKFYTCPTVIDGPRLQRNNDGILEWDSGLIAAPGSTIEITTSEPGASPGQPHEQVYVFVGDEQFGPTPNEHTTTSITVGEGGLVVIKHYSVLNETSFASNSVEFSLCGSDLTTIG